MMSASAMTSRSPVVLAAFAVAGALLIATGTLWVYYGTAVFFEAIRAGFIACF